MPPITIPQIEEQLRRLPPNKLPVVFDFVRRLVERKKPGADWEMADYLAKLEDYEEHLARGEIQW